MVIGPILEPLSQRLARDAEFTDEVTVETKQRLDQRGSRHTISEGELITDYFSFLSQVKAVAEQDDSDQGRKMLATAVSFADRTTYLSQEDRKVALRGLADRHAHALREGSSAELFFFVREQTKQKSQGLLAEGIKAYIDGAHSDIARRVHLTDFLGVAAKADLEKCDPTHAKIVLLDDWSVSGNQLANEVAMLLRTLDPDAVAYRDRIEINLLVARADQLQDKFSDLEYVEGNYHVTQPIPVVAFYESLAARQYEGPMPIGAHSSVDYGFESPISEMRNYIATAQHDSSMRLPYMAAIARTQRDW